MQAPPNHKNTRLIAYTLLRWIIREEHHLQIARLGSLNRVPPLSSLSFPLSLINVLINSVCVFALSCPTFTSTSYRRILLLYKLHSKGLELQSLALLLLVTTQLEVLASLQGELSLGLADNTLQSQHNLLGGLGLLVEDGLGLTTETTLLTVVSSLTLGEKGSLTGLVLGHLVLGVLAALLALAVSLSGLGNVNWGLVLVSGAERPTYWRLRQPSFNLSIINILPSLWG